MHHTIRPWAATAAAVAAVLAFAPASASATEKAKPKPEVTLTFSKLFDLKTQITYSGTELGDIKVSATHGKLVTVLGALGVSGSGLFNLDPSVNKGQSITFDFANDVALKRWDLDDLVDLDGHDKNETFSLKTTSAAGAATTGNIGLHTHSQPGPLVGKSFTFGWSTDNYMIDKLVFGSAMPDVSCVPEPGNVALLSAGLGVLGVVSRRRRLG